MAEGIRAQQIFNVIDAGYRTIGALCSKLNVHRDDMEEDLDYLVETKELIRFEQGTLVAYFRHGEEPVHIRMNGDGKVHTDFKGEVEKASRSRNGLEPQADPAVVELFAAEGKSARELAEHLGIKLYNLKNYLIAKSGRNLPIAQAWKRGRATAIDKGISLGRSAPRGPRKADAKQNGKSKAVAAKTAPKVVEKVAVMELQELPPVKPAISGDKPVHTKAVTFRNGGQVLVAFEGELFDLETPELGLINDLGNVLRKFETPANI